MPRASFLAFCISQVIARVGIIAAFSKSVKTYTQDNYKKSACKDIPDNDLQKVQK
jgi:hypothetical protein